MTAGCRLIQVVMMMKKDDMESFAPLWILWKDPVKWGRNMTSPGMIVTHVCLHIVIPIGIMVLIYLGLSWEKINSHIPESTLEHLRPMLFCFGGFMLGSSCLMPLLYLYGIRRIIKQIEINDHNN